MHRPLDAKEAATVVVCGRSRGWEATQEEDGATEGKVAKGFLRLWWKQLVTRLGGNDRGRWHAWRVADGCAGKKIAGAPRVAVGKQVRSDGWEWRRLCGWEIASHANVAVIPYLSPSKGGQWRWPFPCSVTSERDGALDASYYLRTSCEGRYKATRRTTRGSWKVGDCRVRRVWAAGGCG
ncbi:hypothetical protein B296_00044427 [Ensete ventricosum]|uniref:Uncharacterized protein n=1 Tax=Ensete ventricosum TaxID=4639 RepID=A0A426ZB63_ENSVE|nr:hypothetical protein B296_00044427 [Ensete ventricosum]